MESITNFIKNRSLDLLKYLLKYGSVPRHVAIIIDGSRRYVKENGLKSELAHKLGKNSVMNVFEWCKRLGISEVTVYTFSVENFKRTEQEIKILMKVIGKVLQGFIDDRAAGDGGRSVRIFGNLTMLDKELQKMVAELELNNPLNPDFTINLCIAYNSTEDFRYAFQELQECVQKGLITESDITETLFSKFLYTRESTDPDLLLRTSGEHRLSDFLLWQCSYSVLYVTEVLWPEFSLWDLLSAILHYQRNCVPAIKAKKQHEKLRIINESEQVGIGIEQAHSDKLTHSCQSENKIKIENCLSYLKKKRTEFLKNVLLID